MPTHWPLNGYYDAVKMEGLYEATHCRESCRSFASAPSTQQWDGLVASADALALPGVRMVLGMCENELFSPFFGLLMKFENVRRFAAIIAADGRPESVINAGISGEMLMLDAVRRGLGGVWVAGTYKRKQVGVSLQAGERILALIALGVPREPPTPPLRRKRKELAELCSANFSEAPTVFQEVAVSVRNAPSAMNLQPWQLAYEPEGSLRISVKRPAQRLDLGIALCHAVLAVGNAAMDYALPEDALTARLTL